MTAVQNPSMSLAPRVCPLCGSSRITSVLIDEDIQMAALTGLSFASRKAPEGMHYRMAICGSCDVAYANPAPDIGWLHDQYVNADFEAVSESRDAAQNHGRLIQPLLGRLPDIDRALDIGAGDGAFLDVLRKIGFSQVEGVEPSEGPLRAASDKNQEAIQKGFFSEMDFPVGKYSLVTCFQTVEHVEDVKELTRGVLRLLKPGGLFLIVCHNFRALSARLLKQRSPIFDVEHLQLFSPASLRYLLDDVGYEDIMIAPFSNRYPLDYWFKLAPMPTKLQDLGQRLLYVTKLSQLYVSLRAGNLYGYGFSRS